jgi:uncharacterized SAM-binding protein YcdF (DUF218 family)
MPRSVDEFRRQPRLFRWLRNLFAWLGVLMLLVTFTPFTTWFAHRLADQWATRPGETLIVLTGGEAEDGFLSDSSVIRAHYAVRAWQMGGVKKVLVSGRAGHETANTMADLMVASGIPRDVISTEIVSLTTHESAEAVANLLKSTPGTKTMLTSDYHVYRARRCFAKAGLEVQAFPAPDAEKRSVFLWKRWDAFIQEAQEVAKICYYKYKGWI